MVGYALIQWDDGVVGLLAAHPGESIDRLAARIDATGELDLLGVINKRSVGTDERYPQVFHTVTKVVAYSKLEVDDELKLTQPPVAPALIYRITEPQPVTITFDNKESK